MLKNQFLRLVLLLCSVVFVLNACSDSSDDEASSPLSSADGVLKYVPADTPYVFATPEPMPEEVLDKMQPHVDAILASYKEIMGLVLDEISLETDGSDMQAGQKERFLSIAEEFSDLISSGGLSAAGLARNARSAFYGVGLIPVMRIELIDASAFEATIARFEEKSGGSMSTASVDEQTYRYVGNDDVRLILAVIGNNVVVTVVPAGLSAEHLSGVLGLTLPAQNIASAGVLTELANEYGYTFHALGFVDVERLVATFLDAQTGVNAELLALTNYDHAALTDVCRAELRGMSGVMPRMVAGYTEVSVENFRSSMVLEFRSDIATGLATLAAAVPGLGSDHGALFSFGMSMVLLAAREFYAARLDAMEADPYECDLFADLQNGVAQGREMLNQPIPPIAYGFKGFLAIVDNIDGFDFASKQPPTEIDMRFLIAIDNAEGLLAMGTMFSPDLAALNLQPDGKPVKFETPQMTSQFGAVYIAMTDNALGIAVGADAESGLGDLLEAPAGEPPPIMSMHMDAASSYGLIGDAMMANDFGGETDGEADGEAAEIPPEVKEAIGEIMSELSDLLSRLSVEMSFTEQGLEISTTVTLVE